MPNANADPSGVPFWLRVTVGAVGLVLIVVAVSSYLREKSDGALGMLIVGAFLLVGGPLLHRLGEFKIGLTGAEGKFWQAAEKIVEAEKEVTHGEVGEITASGKVVGPAVVGGAIGATLQPPTAALEGEVGWRAGRIDITAGALQVLNQLSDDDRTQVYKAIDEMKTPGDDVGALLPGSAQYIARSVNDHIRLLYRRRGPDGYVILNVVRPDTTLWRMTSKAL
jgi:hypothetical protein